MGSNYNEHGSSSSEGEEEEGVENLGWKEETESESEGESAEEVTEEIEGHYEDEEEEEETTMNRTVNSKTEGSSIIQDEEPAHSRIIHFLVESNLQQIGKKPILVAMKDGIEYGLFEDNPIEGGTKEKANHHVVGMWLVGWKNGFPASFSLTPTGIKTPVLQTISDSGVRGSAIIRANSEANGVEIPLVDQSKIKSKAKSLATFSGYNPETIKNDLIDLKNGTTMIPPTHQFIPIYNKIMETKGLDQLTKSNTELGMFAFETNMVNATIDKLQENWEKGINRSNLYNFGVQLQRAFTSECPTSIKQVESEKKPRRIALKVSKKTSKTPIESEIGHDKREIFHGINNPTEQSSVVNDDSKCYFNIRVDYKVY
jgi:hypothetical protein